jgi:hypothetical protein
MKRLFLDDNPERASSYLKEYPGAVWVTTSSACIRQLQNSWDLVSLDHDLGGEIYVDSGREDCGMEVVRFLEEYKPEYLKDTQFIVHSFNAVAAVRMIGTLRDLGYKATYIPFGTIGDEDRDNVVSAMAAPEDFEIPGATILDSDRGVDRI